MNKAISFTFRFLCILALVGLFPAQGLVTAGPLTQQSGTARPAHFQEVPAEIQAFFEGGVSIDQFLALNQGRLPHALQAFTDQEVSVVIEMAGEPLAAFYAQRKQNPATLTPSTQQAYHTTLLNAQASVANALQSLGGRVIAQYTKAYNGLLVRVPAGQLQAIRQLPGVVAIRPAPLHRPSLANSVAHIRATQVIQELGLDGTGTTIAVIDTGVDYTHAAFGGPGTPDAYAGNDPTVIEPGSFPTEKVIGGYDFAGVNYDPRSPDPALNTPSPDPDPLDVYGHGTHVTHTAAGMAVPGILGHGVAPGAKIYALKVFGDVLASSDLAVNAIEWALDPNQDNDLSDHVDVINMSLGSDYGIADLLSPDIVAAEYATQVGVVVVAAAGNASDVSYITSTPAVAGSVISVAASTTGFVTGPTVSLPEATGEPRTTFIYNPGNFDEQTGEITQTITAPLGYVGNLFEDDLLCSIPPEAEGTTPLAGEVALIQRGVCGFSDKVNNAAALGAVAAIIFNHEDGGNVLVTMGGPPVAIPAGFVGHNDGLTLASHDGATVTISPETEATTMVDPFIPADTIADFSSRGPRGLDAFQKPDVTAPGVSIFAAKVGSGDKGVPMNGTSMATPHVAGVAALVRQNHPDWSTGQIKAAIMNTAVDLAAGSAEVPRQGAGRVDAYRAVTTDAFAIGDQALVSLSWGLLPLEVNFFKDTRSILLHDLSGEQRVYAVSVEWGENSPTSGVELTTPISVTVTADRRFANIPVDLSIDASQIPVGLHQLEEYYGYVVLTNQADPADRLRVPFYLIPQPHSQLRVTDQRLRLRSLQVDLTHQGPVPSNLWVYPLYEIDPEDVDQQDMADLRMVGMDFAYTDETFGDIFVPAINVYGSWFTPQPYFAEFDLIMDTNLDGNPDLVDFNWNAGAAFGTGDDDLWIVVQVDLSTFTLSLASPFLINTDYNSGLMEWGLAAAWHGLDRATNTDFVWQLFAFDILRDVDVPRNEDSTNPHYFDIARPPFTWELSNNPGPDNPRATLTVRVNDLLGVAKSLPLGVMLVDHNGSPGIGQAYAITIQDLSILGVDPDGGE